MHDQKKIERLIAYHEAGHAVLAALLKIPIERVSFEDKRIYYKEGGDDLNRIIVSQGGIFAAKRYDREGWCGLDDIKLATEQIPEGMKIEDFQEKAKKLVNKNKKCISAVAKSLILKKSLTGEEVQAIVRFILD